METPLRPVKVIGEERPPNILVPGSDCGRGAGMQGATPHARLALRDVSDRTFVTAPWLGGVDPCAHVAYSSRDIALPSFGRSVSCKMDAQHPRAEGVGTSCAFRFLSMAVGSKGVSVHTVG